MGNRLIQVVVVYLIKRVAIRILLPLSEQFAYNGSYESSFAVLHTLYQIDNDFGKINMLKNNAKLRLVNSYAYKYIGVYHFVAPGRFCETVFYAILTDFHLYGMIMAGAAGLEPANTGVKVPCLNRLGYAPRGKDGKGYLPSSSREKN